MKAQIKIEKEVELTTLIVNAGVRHWEDATVNGIEDEAGDLIPCRSGDLWKPIIDIDSGIISNWNQGTVAEVHYKVCDCCGFELIDINGDVVVSCEDGYVPDTLCPTGRGYGDYIIMNVDETGKIEDWNFNIEDFVSDDN